MKKTEITPDVTPSPQSQTPESIRQQAQNVEIRNQSITTYVRIIAALNPRISRVAMQKMAACLADHMPTSGSNFIEEIRILHECVEMLMREAYDHIPIDESDQVSIVELAETRMNDPSCKYYYGDSVHGTSAMGKFAEHLWHAKRDIIQMPIM